MTDSLASKLVVYLMFFVFFTLPILTLLGLSYIYIMYFIVGGVILLLMLHRRVVSRAFSFLIPASFIYIVLLASYINDESSVINLSAIFFVFIIIVGAISVICLSDNGVECFFRLLPVFIVISLVIYFFISVIFSSSFHINNPISDFLSGGRVRLLTIASEGHSILIDLSFLGLVLAFARFSMFNSKLRIPAIILFVMLLGFSRSSTSWLLLFLASFIFFVEQSMNNRPYYRLTCYSVALIVLILLLFSDLNGLLLILRGVFQGNDISIYNDDLTAGRAGLNKLLIEGIKKSPIIGLGHSDPILQYGISNADGKGALSESGLRIAAKYGVPYFVLIIGIVLLPIRVLFMDVLEVRVIGLSISLGVLVMLASNSVLEVPHSFGFVFYIFLSILISEYSKRLNNN